MSSQKGGGNIRYNKNTQEVDINLSTKRSAFTTIQKIAHEFKHADQLLNGKIDLLYNGSYGASYDKTDEREAFNRAELFAEPGDQNSNELITKIIDKQYDGLSNSAINVTDLDLYKSGEMDRRNQISLKRNAGLFHIFNVPNGK